MSPAAILFDFDGVLIESEYESNRHLAEYLTAAGRPIGTTEAAARFMGWSGGHFTSRVEAFLGGPLTDDYRRASADRVARAMETGFDPVAGSVAFVRALPADLPLAVVSSSSTRWIDRHLRHLDLRERFGPHLYSGHEHVARGKPAPDLYLYAADALGVAIADCLVIEDSVAGATGAVASGAQVVGLCAGRHCDADHAGRLRAVGVQHVATDFAEITRLIG
jgi:HAD superfamily hydrolase (TIGR01509 family)